MSEGRPEFIQLEKGDDVPSVRDRLSFHHRKRVLLIWPEQGTVLTRKLDLVLIQRDALRRGIKLALVTHDPQVRQHAQELNISTFETIGSSERARWKRGRTGVFSNRLWRPKKDTPDPEELMPAASRIRGDDRSESPLRRLLLRLAALIFVLALSAALAYVFLPGATIILTPASSLVTSEVMITADRNAIAVDIENGIIPATLLSVTIEETGTISTTGQQRLADVPAQGSVIFVNQTNSAINIPAGTQVSTSAGTPIVFATTDALTLPAGTGQQLEVAVIATNESAGVIGNVDSGLINVVQGNLADQVTVRNINPTFGGDSRSLAAVTAEDQERLMAMVRQQLQSRAFLEMEPRLDASQFLIIETVNIAEERSDWTTFSAQPGEVTETLSLTMRAVVEATAINETFGQQVAFTRLDIPRGRELRPETIVYERGPVIDIFQNGQVTFSLKGQAQVVAQIDTARVQERVASMPLAEAQTLLATELDLQPDTPPQITLTPNWFDQLPVLPFRITVQLVQP